MTSPAPPLLEVEALTVSFGRTPGALAAVRGIDFTIARGERVGLIGESGCGKSLTALALMGLLPEGARAGGHIRFDGVDLATLEESRLARLRGDRLAMVFQEPMTALNPLHPIGRQVAEPLRLHRGLSAEAARMRAIALLERVGLADAARRCDAYPHELSGGQRQRVTIAIALACGPALLIADEPTTALDVTLQRRIMDLIGRLVAEDAMALLLVSHDLAMVAGQVERILVMYGGLVVEDGPTESVCRRRAHPYTRGLFGARPSLTGRRGQRLPTIRGTVPGLADLPDGCPFRDRCDWAIEDCARDRPPPVEVAAGHRVRCIRTDELPPPVVEP